jgi:hypothetical protein
MKEPILSPKAAAIAILENKDITSAFVHDPKKGMLLFGLRRGKLLVSNDPQEDNFKGDDCVPETLEESEIASLAGGEALSDEILTLKGALIATVVNKDAKRCFAKLGELKFIVSADRMGGATVVSDDGCLLWLTHEEAVNWAEKLPF